MRLSELDKDGHLATALQWLDTLTSGGAACARIGWEPKQLAAAREAVEGARKLMDTDLLTLAGERMTQGRLVVIPDECAATGEGHRHGPNGEQQCQYCGKPAMEAQAAAMERAGEVQS